MKTPTVAVLGVVVGLALGVLVGLGISPDGQAVAADEGDHRTLVDDYIRIERDMESGEVHSAQVANETIVMRSEGGRWVRGNGSDRDSVERSLGLWLSAAGGDVRSVWTPEGCGDDDCRIILETTDGGNMVNESLHDPPMEWRWTVRANETTQDPIRYWLDIYWTEAWQEPDDA